MDRADCPVFRPSRKDMSRSFEKYIASIEQECQPYGICKITAAKGWTPCAQGYTGQDFDWEIARIEQNITRETMASGVYTAAMTPLRKQSVRSFKEATELPSEKRLRPPAQHLDNLPGLESAYWRTIPGSTEYGADNEGSLFDEGIKGWNLARLDSCLSRGLASDPAGQSLKGVNTPYLYYGRWKATFAWHTEDMDLHSVNYLHYGAPKVWYCIPPSDRQKMDAFVAKKLYAQHGRCREFMRHKTVLIKPDTLEAAGIAVQKVVQHPGDFIINFPGAYHSGFNVGFNCAESTNFATTSWIQNGAVAQFCSCTPGQEPVRLDMGLFLAEAPDDHTRQLAPAAAAKLPQPMKVLPRPPVSSSSRPRKPTKAPASPSKARGRPKGSSKVATAAGKSPMAPQLSLGGLGKQESDDNDVEVASIGEADSGGRSQNEAAPAVVVTTKGEPMAKGMLPISDILKWRGTGARSQRSQRSSHRAGGEGCPSSFQKLLSR
ncbi:hypothetical protein WJX79_010709 [Trebouxia sp. C0005]